MRSILLISFFSALTCISSPARSASPQLQTWVNIMTEPGVKLCSQRGPEWQLRVKEALFAAKANTKDFLPTEFWDRLIQVSNNAEGRSASGTELAYCEEFVRQYSDPKLITYFRGMFAYGLISTPAIKCMLWYPDLAADIKTSWAAAFVRNGFKLDETFIKSGLQEWRERGVKPIALEDNQVPFCKELIAHFNERKFDEAVSEKSMVRHFTME